VALTAEQMAQLTSDIVWLVEQTITLADGSTTTALVPQVYVRVQPGDLDHNGALLAGANVDIKTRGDFVNQGDVAGRKLVNIDAGNIRNLAGANISGQQVGLQATQNIDIIGSKVTASDVLSVKAGGDINVTSTTKTWESTASSTTIDRVAGLYVTNPSGTGVLNVNAGNNINLAAVQVINAGTNGATVLAAGGDLNVGAIAETRSLDITGDARNFYRTSQVTHVGSTINGAGNVILQAGSDVNLTAAKVDAGQAMAVQAGRDINSATVTDVSTFDQSAAGKRTSRAVSALDETVRGSELNAGGNIALQAGRDVTLQAATVASVDGGIGLSAGRDVNLTAAQEQHDLTIDEQRKKKGTLSSKTTTTHDEWHDSIARTTTLSGETVTVAAGRDLTSEGAQIAGTGDVLLAAGRDLTLGAAQSTATEVHDKTVKTSGVFGNGGIGFTIGKKQTDTQADSTGVSHTGSTVGSLQGDITLVAGNALTIEGSDVVALQGDITGKARSISITDVQDTSTAEQQTRFKQGGLTVAISAPVLSVLQTANDLNKAQKQSGGDGRMQALAAGTAALNAYNSAGAIKQLGGLGSASSAGDMASAANVGISATIGSSKSESRSTQASSQARGSTLQAGGDVTLIATGGGQDSNILVRGSDITAGNNVLLAADNDVTLEAARNTVEQHSTSKSSSGAIGVAATYGKDGGAMGVTVSASRGRGNADGEDVSHRNTHVSAGNTATIISGGDTTLRGAQLSADKVVANVGGDLNIESLQDTSTYDSKNKSMGGSMTVGIGFSASASYSDSKVKGDYASVTEQSGIQAGAGGFDITVAGNTDLKGAVIASTQEAVDAGVNRLQTGTLTTSDIENHSAYSAKSMNLSGGYDVGNGKDGSTSAAPTTSSGSTWSMQNFDTGAQGAAAGYASKKGSDSSTTSSGISSGTVVITDQAGQQALTGKSAEETLAAIKRDVLTGDDANGLAKAWDGQKLQQQMEAQAQITAMFGQQASKAVGDYAQKQMDLAADKRQQAVESKDQGEIDCLNAEANQLESQWGANGSLRLLAHTVIGGLTGGVEGATGAAAGTLTAPRVAQALQDADLPKGLADALTGVASTLAGAAVGGAVGGAAGVNEVANNYLNHQDTMELLAEMAACNGGNSKACDNAKALVVLSEANNEALAVACKDYSSTACRTELNLAAEALQTKQAGRGEYFEWLAGNGISLKQEDIRTLVTHTTEADLIRKLGCATAGGNCQSWALMWGRNPELTSSYLQLEKGAVALGAGSGVISRAKDLVEGAVGAIPLFTMWDYVDGLSAYGSSYWSMKQEQTQAAIKGIPSALGDYAGNVWDALLAVQNGYKSSDIYDVYGSSTFLGKAAFDAVTLVEGGVTLTRVTDAAIAARAARAEAASIKRKALENSWMRESRDMEAGGSSLYDQYKLEPLNSKGKWDWPDDNGFDGPMILATVERGYLIDRYGSFDGALMSPVGMPYAQRAMAPGSRFGYNQFEVLKPFPVQMGRVAPAFGEVGGGVQVLPGFKYRVNVKWLMDNGYIKELGGVID